MSVLGNGYYNNRQGKTIIRYVEGGEYFFVIEACRFCDELLSQDDEACHELIKRCRQMLDSHNNTPSAPLGLSEEKELNKELSFIAEEFLTHKGEQK